ncbi:DNA-binding transcriptional regulator YbjK [Arthrobacter pigmenti]|uniref:DNA-binding transcriptional regulator YbjK n=1 Tax=Arthrobacter pigmenti TaxID=271432 RepID=A0A846RUA9_9MICC|nr:TetR/AcrR family transcriptional regulator [Arthrobacter pigmenti]NJC23727.1 DNA-binding transcriptional regulator YbjK [Arthrobacter pigmenti]
MREQLLLDAAIEVLAAGGVRQLTHRAVDAAAQLPLGSTSNRFRSRDALLTGALNRILEREMAVWSALASTKDLDDVGGFASALGRLVEKLTGEHRSLSLARHAVFVEASNRPQLGEEAEKGRAELANWMMPALLTLGSRDPKAHLQYLLALIDGLLTSRLVHPAPDADPAPAIAALLRGLISH